MRSSSFPTLVKALPLVLGAALMPGCADSPVTPGTDDLTEEEAYALAKQLGLTSLAFGREQGAQPSSGARRSAGPASTEEVSVSYSLTRPCILGGSVTSTGQIDVVSDDATQLAIVDLTATETHHACVFQATTTTVAITGDPDVTTTVHASSEYGEAFGTQSVAVVGAFTWEADDGRSGRCAIDLLVAVDVDNTTETTRGEVCGFSFDVTVTGAG